MIPKTLFSLFATVVLTAMAFSATSDKDLKPIFNGKSLDGWRLMAVHGGSGGVWTVEKGVLVGNQDQDHKGGLLGTETKYSDFEIELEFKIDYPVDTGLFLRTREDGMGYQITIDNKKDGFIGSLYAPAEGGYIQQNKNWSKYFKDKSWNKLRARIEGQPAHVTAWLNGAKMTDYTDHKNRFPRLGYIGLQVHGGADAWCDTCRARFRNVRIKELNQAQP
ncbi:MAG TPA: DUF1080 domain-containing protein [Blastocatellia bacterium]|nr:DUF1080 domain-containing protein [Blastocatellia bacterium]